jgi:hypothetical protein
VPGNTKEISSGYDVCRQVFELDLYSRGMHPVARVIKLQDRTIILLLFYDYFLATAVVYGIISCTLIRTGDFLNKNQDH